MNDELWKQATDNAKIDWLRQQVLGLNEKCDELKKENEELRQNPGTQLSDHQLDAIDENLRF